MASHWFRGLASCSCFCSVSSACLVKQAVAGQDIDPSPCKDATLRSEGGDPGAGGFPTETIGRCLREAKCLGLWAGLGCGCGAQTF